MSDLPYKHCSPGYIGKGKDKMEPEKKTALDEVQVIVEDLLKGLAHRGRMKEKWDPGERLANRPAEVRGAVLDYLVKNGYIEGLGSSWRLTERGIHRAVEILRAHRLLETYLARKKGRPAEELHAEADREEHYLSVEKANQLADSMNRPRFDPHGDPIPERASDLHQTEEVPLTDMPVGSTILVVHIEDEPPNDFEILMEMGLAPELPLKVIKSSDEEMEIELLGERINLPQRLAAHVEVYPLPEGDTYCDKLRRLTSLKSGETGIVEYISSACIGPDRRRLQDFGMVPGSEVGCEFSSPFGSPVAYSVRGSVIGLRRSQARNILIRRNP